MKTQLSGSQEAARSKLVATIRDCRKYIYIYLWHPRKEKQAVNRPREVTLPGGSRLTSASAQPLTRLLVASAPPPSGRASSGV